MARNITEVRLLNVPLESDYKHTLYFANKTAQENYFKGRTMKTGANLSYQRKDKIIRWSDYYDNLIGCNYVMYKNEGYTDKWYYAFITKMEYVNDDRTDIYIETDVMQTWMFDYTLQPCFVEREHVFEDGIGLHTIPEGLELGEYVIDDAVKNEDLLEDTIIIGSTANLNSESFGNVTGSIYGGVYSGVRYYEVTYVQANTILKELADAGKSDAITGIFIAPKNFVESSGSPYPVVSFRGNSVKKEWVDSSNNPAIKKPTKLNNYTPRNNKLFTYPYCYLLVSNNSGGSAIYNYELFPSGDYCEFNVCGTPTPGYSVRLIPAYYKGESENNLDGLNLGKFPVCSWNTDVYTNWLTQNSVNIKVSQAQAVANTGLSVASMFTGNVLGGIGGAVNGLAQIGNTMGQVYAHSLQPPQAEGNLNNGDVTFSSGHLTFTAYKMSIKYEYAQIIDKFFDMFGYKVNFVHTPNKNHRENYWYTKTIDCHIDGSLPMEDLAKIKSCYDNGITFWRNASNMGDYTVSNGIV